MLAAHGCAGDPKDAADGGETPDAMPQAMRDAATPGDAGSALGVCPGAHDPATRRILTESGVVVGVARGETDAFLGIPFAAPPTGARRYALPEPVGCFEGERGADALGPRCPQLDEAQTTVVGEEDCLQLNVWAPSTRNEPLPVLVFIHGGGHAVGSAVDPLYEGASLAAAGAVVITVNYRLGALGFALHPDIPTNLGMRDLVAALEWVQRNVAQFGGDRARVTIFGESAGAVCVCTLLAMPSAQGLFGRAIVQSGGCKQREASRYAEGLKDWLPNTGCAGATDELACLRGLDAATLVQTEPTGFPSVAALGQVYSSHVDGDVLPASTEAAWAAGTALKNVSVIVGANRDETAASVPPNLDQTKYEQLVRASFGALADQVLQQYPADAFATPTAAYVALTSEAKFICGAQRAAQVAAASGIDVRLYMFSYDEYTTLGRTPAATHGIELPYIFGSLGAIGVGNFTYRPNAKDLAMRDTMQARWLSFARDGIPTAPGGPTWPALAQGYLVLDTPSREGDGDYPDVRCEFWAGLAP